MFFRKIPSIYYKKLVFKFLDGCDFEVKIIHDNKIIYPDYKKVDNDFLYEISLSAEYSKNIMLGYSLDMLEKDFINYCSINPKSIDLLYYFIYKDLDYYSFYLPTNDIIYIKKKEHDYGDFLKAKILYFNLSHLINPKRNAIILSVPQIHYFNKFSMFSILYAVRGWSLKNRFINCILSDTSIS